MAQKPAEEVIAAPEPEVEPTPQTSQSLPEETAAENAPAEPVEAFREGQMLSLPLSSIVPRLPPSLAALVSAPASACFSVPLQTIMAQLPRGLVQISFGELRCSSPEVFADSSEFDQTVIDLPLKDILGRIDLALLKRRPGQRKVEIPDDVLGVFDVKNSFKVAASSAHSARPSPATPPSVTPPARPYFAPIQPAPARPEAPPKVEPPKAAPPPISIAPAPIELAPKPLAMPTMAPKTPHVLERAEVSSPKEILEGEIVAPLSDLSEKWPEEILQVIRQNQLEEASVRIPLDRVDPGMKTGRIVFAWSELCQWLEPGAPDAAGAEGDLQLELPLKVVAPLFLAQRQPAKGQRKMSVVSDIPDIFSGVRGNVAPEPAKPKAEAPVFSPAAAPLFAMPSPKPGAISMSPPPPPAPAPEEPSQPVVAPISLALTPEPPVPASIGALFGNVAKTNWTPREIVEKLRTLSGVAGSLIAMNDGLLVASDFPEHLRVETFAAFLPQIFGRMTQYSKELQLGQLSAVTLDAGDAPCMMFKSGAVFFVVLGQPGEKLPDASLRMVAAELAKRNP